MAKNNKHDHKIKEVIVSQYQLNNYSIDDGLSCLLTDHSEQMDDLLQQLLNEVKKEVASLTKRQQRILKLTLQGYSQVQIASRLRIGQPAVHSSLYGRPGGKKSGSIPKLKHLCECNANIRILLAQIERLKRVENEDE